MLEELESHKKTVKGLTSKYNAIEKENQDLKQKYDYLLNMSFEN